MQGAEIAIACLFGKVAILFCGLLLTLICLSWWKKIMKKNGERKIGVFPCLMQ